MHETFNYHMYNNYQWNQNNTFIGSNTYVALAYLFIWFLSTIGFSQQTKTNNVLISINTVSIYYAVYVSVTGIYVT
jgi:hypothetical protein